MTTPRRSMVASGRRGFTLVEVITTMVIVAIIGVVSSTLLLSAVERYHAAATRAELVNAASAAMERITVTLRDIPQRVSVTPSVPSISAVTANSITWDGGMSLAISGTSVRLTINGDSTTLAEHVSAFEVTVFDKDNAAMDASLSGGACNSIRRVQITLTLSRDGVSETLRSRVFLRCMMSGAAT